MPENAGRGRLGLDKTDRQILTAIIEKFNGGPVGLSTVAVAVGEEADTIEELYEPFLIQQGFLERTPRGRRATAQAREMFGAIVKKEKQSKMF